MQFLRLGGSLRREEVLCTSLEGTNVPWGADFVDEIRRELTGSRLVIQLVTPAFLESSFCLCELGAQWAMGLACFPLLVPPATFDDLPMVDEHTNVPRIDEPRELDGLFRAVGTADDVADWNKQREAFEAVLRPLLDEIRERGFTKVPAERHVELQRSYAALQRRTQELEDEAGVLTRQRDELAARRERADVDEVLADGDLDAELELAIQRAAQAFSPLPALAIEAIFHRHTGEVFAPDPWERGREIDEAVRDRFVVRDEGRILEPNGSDPTVKDALRAFGELDDFALSTAQEERFERDHRLAWDLGNWRVWQALDLA